MKAIVRDTYGSPDVLELRDIDRPEIADEEVLVRVHAAGVGRDVWHVMTGLGGGRQGREQVPARR
jgi:NADPH:quinone reductase-like Zn-dependent oxidoreductase